MADPPRFSQPDTTSSTLYDYAADYDDSGAVHTDSGVPNKTAYLITDGTAAEPDGVFHGRVFAGIGTARAATLYWATLQMLTPGSDFVDLAAALRK
jgi:Zn-dependent metalloprotease